MTERRVYPIALSPNERRMLISVLRKRKALDPALNHLLERVALALEGPS